jgi:DNA-binding transcriptional ArsR family regulator
VKTCGVDLWTALGDATRRAVFARVAQRPRPVGEIASELPVSRSAVSEHFGVLKEGGLVVADEPPERILFSWDISPYLQLETDLARASEVEIRFIAESEERTRVALEHRHLDRNADGWEGLRAGVEGDEGWPLHLSLRRAGGGDRLTSAARDVARMSRSGRWLAERVVGYERPPSTRVADPGDR